MTGGTEEDRRGPQLREEHEEVNQLVGVERIQHQFPFHKAGIYEGPNLLVVFECLRLRTLGSLTEYMKAI